MERDNSEDIERRREVLLHLYPRFNKSYEEIAKDISDDITIDIPNIPDLKLDKDIDIEKEKRKYVVRFVDENVNIPLIEGVEEKFDERDDKYFIAYYDILLGASNVTGILMDSEDALDGSFKSAQELLKSEDTHENKIIKFASNVTLARKGAQLLGQDSSGLKLLKETVKYLCNEENELGQSDELQDFHQEFVSQGAELAAQVYKDAFQMLQVNEE